MLPHSFLAGQVTQSVGKFDRSEEEGKKAIELDPDNAYGYHNLANSYILRNRPAEAEAVLKRAYHRKLNIHEFAGLEHQIAFLKGDKQEMERAAALGEEKLSAENWIYDMSGDFSAYYGHLGKRERHGGAPWKLAEGTGHPDQAAQHHAGIAVREFLFGNVGRGSPGRQRQRSRLLPKIVTRRQAQRWHWRSSKTLAPKLSSTILDRRFPESTCRPVRSSAVFCERSLALNRRESCPSHRNPPTRRIL